MTARRSPDLSGLPRRLLLTFALAVVGVPTLARAATDVAAIQAPIAALDTALLAAMHAGKETPFKQRFDALAPAIDGAFDLAAILRISVGTGWAALPADQQSAALSVFRRFTIASYVANFDKFDGERLDMLPALREAGSEQIVQTKLVPASGTPTPLDYVMRQSENGWRAVDVLLDGSISRVAVQRSDFRALLHPGDAKSLIESLQRKVGELSGGTVS